MTLRELMGNGQPEVEIAGLAYSSDRAAPGTLFFCVPGFKSDGHDFAPDAVRRGAVALVCQRPHDLGVGAPVGVVLRVGERARERPPCGVDLPEGERELARVENLDGQAPAHLDLAGVVCRVRA